MAIGHGIITEAPIPGPTAIGQKRLIIKLFGFPDIGNTDRQAMYGLAVRGTDPILYPTDITTVVTTTTDAGFTIRKLYMVAVKEAIPTATTIARNIEAMNTAAITMKITEAELPDARQPKTKAHREEPQRPNQQHNQPKTKVHREEPQRPNQQHNQPKTKARQEEPQRPNQQHNQPKTKVHREERQLPNQQRQPHNRQHNPLKIKAHREEQLPNQQRQPHNRQHNPLKRKNRPDEIRHQAAIREEEDKRKNPLADRSG
jgi:hypothetical protein